MPKRRSRFGNTRRLPSGRWQARYERPPGEWHYAPRTFREAQAAQDWLDDQNVDRRRGSWVDPKKGRTTFGSWAQRWKDTTVTLRASTKARDFGYLDRYAIPVWENISMGDIDHLAVQDWVADLNQRLAPATVAKALQIVSKVFSFAVTAGVLAANPCADVKPPKIEREEMHFLSVDQVDKLGDAIDPRYRSLIYVGAYGGLRMSEMFGLKWTRADPSSGRLSITENLVEVEGLLYTERCKTRASIRTVTLPKVALKELKGVERSGEYVWEAPKGGPVRLASWRTRYWYPAVENAGLAGIRPHDLRHTCAALMIAAGAQPLEVSRRLGHTSVAFTLDRYGHLMPGAEDNLNASLDRLAKKSSGVAK